MKVALSTRVYSAHFAPGCAIPYVKSPLIKPEKTARHTIVHRIPHEEPLKTMVPSLKDLCQIQLQDQLSKLHQLEQEHASTKKKLSSHIDMYDQRQNKLTETMETVNSLKHEVSLLQADRSQLQSLMVSKFKDIESLEAEISHLTLETVLLKLVIDRFKQNKFQLRAEGFNGLDKDINFYTGFCS